MNKSRQQPEKQIDAPEILPHRSPLLLDRQRSLLLVMISKKNCCHDQRTCCSNLECVAVNVGPETLAVPSVVTEQYPEKLGATVRWAITGRSAMPSASVCLAVASAVGRCIKLRRTVAIKLLFGGIETHVCVLQTALDLLADDWQVFVVADGVGSRNVQDTRLP